MAEIRFTADLGAEVTVSVGGESPREVRQAVLGALRQFGRLGWRAVRVPTRGFRFPLEAEPGFDWSLLGARRARCTVDGEERDGVWFADRFYTRRELAPNPRQKLGPAVKYSRGARSTDPAELVEEGDGGFRYVTLAVFRGGGRPREEFHVSDMDSSAAPDGDAERRQTADDGVPPLPNQDDHKALLLFIRSVGPRLDDAATFDLEGRTENLKQFAREHWAEIKAQLPVARAVANAMAAALSASHPEGG
jgi:hypothetical protein